MSIARASARRLYPDGDTPGPQRQAEAESSQPARWRILGGYPALRIFAAVPDGSRRSYSPGGWYAAVRAAPDVAALRSDARRNVLAVAWVLARYTDWQLLAARPGWDLLCERTGLGRRTVARWLAWLQARGLLGLVETGSTPDQRPWITDDGAGNRAAEYLLTEPAPDPEPGGTWPGGRADEPGTGTPSDSRQGVRDLQEKWSPHARGTDHQPAHNESAPAQTSTSAPKRERRAAEREAATRLQQQVPVLRRLSAAHVAFLARPYWIQGWTVEGIARALDHDPDGQPWTYTTEVRHPPGWFRHRMAVWKDEDGTPLESRRQQLEREAEQQRTAQAQRQEAWHQAQTDAANPEQVHTLVTRLRDRLLEERAARRHTTHPHLHMAETEVTNG